jgi:hypothetical protein
MVAGLYDQLEMVPKWQSIFVVALFWWRFKVCILPTRPSSTYIYIISVCYLAEPYRSDTNSTFSFVGHRHSKTG